MSCWGRPTACRCCDRSWRPQPAALRSSTRLSAAADARIGQHRAGNAQLTPCGVGDALACAVRSSGRDELRLEGFEVDLGVVGLECGLQVETFLDEVQSLQWICGQKRTLDRSEPLLHGVGRALATPAGTMRLEGFEIPTNSPALVASFGECSFVLITHRSALRC